MVNHMVFVSLFGWLLATLKTDTLAIILIDLYLLDIKPTANVSEAFKDISVAILVGAMPRREGMERKDLLKANVRIFKAQGQALEQFAKKDVKVSSYVRWLFLVIGSIWMRDG